jgi:hypothetical protein
MHLQDVLHGQSRPSDTAADDTDSTSQLGGIIEAFIVQHTLRPAQDCGFHYVDVDLYI